MTSPFAALPQKHFRLILADPAWQTVLWSGVTRTPTQKAGEDHYPTMSLDEMAALPVNEIAADHSVLAMWAIGSHLDQALALGQAWGFHFTRGDLFIWIKQRRIRPDQIDLFTGDVAEPPIGMGKYTRNQVEICLLFKRGKGVPVADHAVRQIILAPKREHSRKPVEQYDRLEALFGNVPRLEMNARNTRPGWSSWGNEVGKFAEAVG